MSAVKAEVFDLNGAKVIVSEREDHRVDVDIVGLRGDNPPVVFITLSYQDGAVIIKTRRLLANKWEIKDIEFPAHLET